MSVATHNIRTPTLARPQISVIIPAYNVAGYIAETLDSVLAQTFCDYEIIVINDGSPDTPALERVLTPYLAQISYLKQENQGAGPARNRGIQQARAELIAFLDGDDVWLPDFLASQIAFLRADSYDLVYANALIFGGSPLDGRTYMQDAPSQGIADFVNLLDGRCSVITSGTLARKQAVLDAGLFEWKNYCGQDRNLWLRMAHRGQRFGYQREVLLKYRVRPDGLSGNSMQRLQRAIDGYHRIAAQVALNATEQEIMQRHLRSLETELEIERGKSLLLAKDFAGATEAFAKANKCKHSRRLQAIVWLTQHAPHLLLGIYRARRHDAIAFVPQPEKQTQEDGSKPSASLIP